MRSARFLISVLLISLMLSVFLALANGRVGLPEALAAASEAPVSQPGSASGTKPVDVMLALDNSGSMRQNDPKSLMREVVLGFATSLARDSRLGIVVFDEKVQVALALTGVESPDFKDQITESLKRVDYRGRLTDIPSGVERALYELRQNGRAGAERLIVFVTDGIVDLGSPPKDLERARWLRETLAQEAKRLGIRIFGIAFTESADFQLIQSVAETTSGDYFRVLSASDIPGTFERISVRIREIARQVPMVPPPVQPTVVVVTNWQPWVLAAVGLIVLGIVAVLVARRSKPPVPKVIVPPSTLYDPSGHAGADKYVITETTTRIGRDSSTNDIVIPQDTVSLHHAEIVYRDGTFYLRDLRSTNGTFVNGKKISDPETIREVVLKHRDRVRFDAYEFEFALAALEDAQQTRIAGAPVPGATRVRPESPAAPIESPPAEVPQVAVDPDPVITPVEVSPMTEGTEAPTKVKNEMCPRHPSWKATELCTACGRAWCEWCMNEKDGKAVCVECVGNAA